MKYKKDIEDNIKNLLYYKDKVMASISKQLDEDFKEVQSKGLNQESCEKRWRSLSLAHSQCFQILDQTDYILANVKYAEEEDKVFNVPEAREVVKEDAPQEGDAVLPPPTITEQAKITQMGF